MLHLRSRAEGEVAGVGSRWRLVDDHIPAVQSTPIDRTRSKSVDTETSVWYSEPAGGYEICATPCRT